MTVKPYINDLDRKLGLGFRHSKKQVSDKRISKLMSKKRLKKANKL